MTVTTTLATSRNTARATPCDTAPDAPTASAGLPGADPAGARPSLRWVVRHPVPDLERFGRAQDGGYVVPRRALDHAALLVGLGINDEWSFETDVLARTAVRRLVAVDGSVGTGRFLRLVRHEGRMALGMLLTGRWAQGAFHWDRTRHWLRTLRGFRALLAPPGRHFVRRMLEGTPGPAAVTWPALLAAHAADGAPLFVKMDIEGAEYDVLPALLADADRITGLAVEFHDVGRHWPRFCRVMAALAGPFAVVHVHGNNWQPLVPGTGVPEVLEVSFLHRRLMTAAELGGEAEGPLPVPGLDWPNRPGVEDYRLEVGGGGRCEVLGADSDAD